MKVGRFLLSVVLVVLVSFTSFGQSSEAFSAPGNDMLKSAHVYPNPAVEFVNVKFEQPVARQVTIQLHSIIGNQLEVESEIVDDFEVRLKVKDLPSGYYLLDVKLPGVTHSAFKFLKR